MEARTTIFFDGNTKPSHIKKLVKKHPRASYKYGDCLVTYHGDRDEAEEFIKACESSERVVAIVTTR